MLPWTFVEDVNGWIDAFTQGASDRWAYHLAAETRTLGGLANEQGLEWELQRQISRSDDKTRAAFMPKEMLEHFRSYQAFRTDRDRFPNDKPRQREAKNQAFVDFITLCQSASFLARGRDQ